MSRINYDLIGKKFNRLTVVDYAIGYVSPNGAKKKQWLCCCDCGNEITVTTSSLISGKIKSCGCLKSEKTIERNKSNKKYNNYDLSGEFGIGYTNNDKIFFFDLEDYDKIKNYCWHIVKGYAVAKINGHTVSMHRMILDVSGENIVDHINHNTFDNRKSNLRICTNSDNSANTKISVKNTSGAKGVDLRSNGKYTAYITKDNIRYWLGTYDTVKEASDVYDRKALEFFGEFACLNNYKEQ